MCSCCRNGNGNVEAGVKEGQNRRYIIEKIKRIYQNIQRYCQQLILFVCGRQKKVQKENTMIVAGVEPAIPSDQRYIISNGKL